MNERLLRRMTRYYEAYEEDPYFSFQANQDEMCAVIEMLDEAIEKLDWEKEIREIAEQQAVKIESPKPRRRQFERIRL